MFVVNVEVYLRRGDRCLLIRRGEGMANAAGMLSGVGGKAEPSDHNRDDILEETARREVAEEVGVDLTGATVDHSSRSGGASQMSGLDGEKPAQGV